MEAAIAEAENEFRAFADEFRVRLEPSAEGQGPLRCAFSQPSLEGLTRRVQNALEAIAKHYGATHPVTLFIASLGDKPKCVCRRATVTVAEPFEGGQPQVLSKADPTIEIEADDQTYEALGLLRGLQIGRIPVGDS